jgi:hypothetical protein
VPLCFGYVSCALTTPNGRLGGIYSVPPLNSSRWEGLAVFKKGRKPSIFKICKTLLNTKGRISLRGSFV